MNILGCTGLLASGEEAAIAVFVMGGLVAVVAIVAHQWRTHREAAYNARLKQMMIERGMTSDEIVRVIRATHDPVVDENPGRGRKSL